MVNDYGHALADDPHYAGKAARVSELARDISEIVAAEPLEDCLARSAGGQAIAFHSPCSLQHAQRINGVVEQLLGQAGYVLQPVADGHLCCGSAGTYSILQAELSGNLRSNKLAALQAGEPSAIATANIGCLMHMRGHAKVRTAPSGWVASNDFHQGSRPQRLRSSSGIALPVSSLCRPRLIT
jgi:glycolate oxidase iron-sulfur subunit